MAETDFLSGWADLAYSARHMVFEHCADAIALLDPYNDRFSDLNIAACQLFGYPRQALLTLPISKLFGHQLAELIVFSQAVLEKGRGWNDELSCNCKSGERMQLEITATSLHIKGQQQIILVLRERRRQRFHQDQADTERTMRGG
ncbi:PAS domain-containing protein [Pseudomonas juntendi]|nr:PAS domain-containing protein [Pseudomonas juntendi]